jgi:hypothetical protein
LKYLLILAVIVSLLFGCRKDEGEVVTEVPLGSAALDLNGSLYPIEYTEVVRSNVSGKVYLHVIISGTDRSQVRISGLELRPKTYRIIDDTYLSYQGSTGISYQTRGGELRITDVKYDETNKYSITGSFRFRAESIVAADSAVFENGFLNALRER